MAETFWTARRLRELRTKARKMDLTQLSKHFERSEDSCYQALIYANSMMKMRLEKIKETVHGKLRNVIKLKPGYALYARRQTENVGYSGHSNEME